jgi:hypothetical protein
VWLLSTVGIPYFEGNNWVTDFDTFWNTFSNKPITNIQYKTTRYGQQSAVVNFNDSEFVFGINRGYPNRFVYNKEYFTITVPPDAGPWSDPEPGITDKRGL